MKRIDQITSNMNQAMMDYRTPCAKSNMHERSETQTNDMTDHLWVSMGEMYGKWWIKDHGVVASSTWTMAIEQLTPEQLQRGIDRCRDRIFSGNAYAPTMAIFLALVHGQDEGDLYAAFLRCLNKAPEGRVEIWVFQNSSFNLRALSHEKAERMHKKFMQEAAERDRRGELVLAEEMLKELPLHSVINTNDVWAKEYESEHGKALDPRIQKLRAIQGKGKT